MSKKREQLFPLWLPSVIALGVVAALIANYPREGVQARSLSLQAPSELSIAYLEAWLRMEPASPEYLASLADQYLKVGRWQSAIHTAQKLGSLGTDEATLQRALLLELAAIEQLAYEQPAGHPAREAMMSRFKGALERTEHYQWDVPRMQVLARQARQTGNRALMIRYYRKLAIADVANAPHWQLELAQAALAEQHYEEAATAYFAAYEAAIGTELKRRYFISALQVLVSDNRVVQACEEAARRLDTLSRDPETLRYLIGLARQVNRVDLVTRYARALVEGGGIAGRKSQEEPGLGNAAQRPVAMPLMFDASPAGTPRRTAYLLAGEELGLIQPIARASRDVMERYDLAFTAFVESSQLDDAQKLAQKALDEGLDTALWARRLAKVAQWNNQSKVALEAWILLARTSDDMEAWGNVLRLAPQVNDSEAYLSAWKKTASKRAAAGSDFEQSRHALFAEYMKIGHWDAALDVVDELSQAKDAGVREHAVLLRVQASEQLAYQFPTGDPRRATAMDRYMQALEDAAGYGWDVPTMAWLAQKASEAGEHTAMVAFYQKLAHTDQDQASKWHAKLGDAAAQQQSYGEAAQAYFAAQQAADTLDEQRLYFLMALKTLVAAGQVDQACTEGERHAGELARDPQTLRYLLDIARQANRTSLMARYARALVESLAVDSHSSYFSGTRRPRLQAHGLLPDKIVYRDGLAGAGAAEKRGRARIRLISTQRSVVDEQSVQRSRDYELAFEALVASKQLDEAEALAEKALAEQMDILVWAPRLAQVAQWNDHPQKALKHWLQYAQASGDQQAWETVLKLSRQLDNNLAYLLAIREKADRAPADMEIQDELVRTYESLGQPESAMSYLKSRARGALRQPMLERYAAVAARSGNDAAALATYTTLQAEYPENALYAMHIASLEYRQGNLANALAALRQVRGNADDRPETAPYWSLYGELAQLTGNRTEAAQAYKHLLATGRAGAADLNTMTYFYEGHPIDAGRIAEMAYRADGSAQALEAAVSFYTQAKAWPRVRMLLDELSPEQLERFEHSVGLLNARAEYYLATGQWQAALADFQRAVRLPEAGDQIRITYLWALVDFGTDDALRMATRTWHSYAIAHSGYWGALAAAYLRLNNPAQAVQFLRLQYVQSSEDPLWLMTLADAEAAAGHDGRAWRHRRNALIILERKAAARQQAMDASALRNVQQRSDLRAARIALSQIFANGDVSRDLLIHLLRQAGQPPESAALANSILADTAGLPSVGEVMGGGSAVQPEAQESTERVLDEAARSVVLAWAISGEHNELARAWLAREHAKRLLRHANAAATLALVADDRAEIGRLLESREAAAISFESRLQALTRTGQSGAAETLAFEAARGAPDNDVVNDLMAETLLRDRPSVGVDSLWFDSEPFEYLQTTVVGGLKLTGRLGLNFEAIQRNQRSTDKVELPWVPSIDREYSVALHDTTIDRDLQVKIGYRDAMASFLPVSVRGEFNRQGPLSFGVMLGVNQFTDISPQLQVGAVQDMIGLGMQWNPESRWFMSGAVQAGRIYSQDSTFQGRTYIGRRVHLNADLGYRIRSAYPDWSARLTVTRGMYGASDRMVGSMARLLPDGTVPLAAELIPENFTQYGLMVSLGFGDKAVYARAWRPFMDAGMVHDSHDGWGPQILFGLGGSVLGRDRLQFHVSYEKASQSTSQRTMQVGLSYRILY